ncbi:hypothetical protein FHR72_003866 [Mycolicibacterium iranicum]|uniref:Uncharacterized protein n=1 Tax=Mycolicibacterium iranicum TaxID=912594 RepID=A0A839Q9Q0_MYCIR|nr:hypothetical protein [Mycolicibacterium iranicum]
MTHETINPHSLYMLGLPNAPIYTLVFDRGSRIPATVVNLPKDLAILLRRKLNERLGT